MPPLAASKEEEPALVFGEQNAGEIRNPLPPGGGWQNLIHIHHIGRVLARIASRAVGDLLALATSFLEPLQRKVSERIRADIVANLVDRLVCRNKLLL